ncbi:unnamed protein product [Rotaria sp. Silwood1]|nr:unnamed protein product [Rotaria sp. Silwood1]CAF0900812.1 unnamed protein product [Rotaria sp. Silwood1]CAF3349812.1 unnamed protein product [Rotaria sp. Silwood1]CAF3372767.1 unnamed protein product [Rotaria sp. Silwood1]CAF4526930.1 unnamed protein product [Rotaria sp. Silwood1]
MGMIISSAPVVQNELVTKIFVEEVFTKADDIKENIELSEIVTDKLLFFDHTMMSIDANVEIHDNLYFKYDDTISEIPTTENSQLFQMKFSDNHFY